MFVKICGMTSEDAVTAAVAAGADAVGFVFAPSPREVSAERALELSAGIPNGVLRVAVMHHPTAEHASHVLEVLSPDWLQTDVEDLAELDLPGNCTVLPVYRNGRSPAGPPYPARLLFEGALSGSGKTADWGEACTLAAKTDIVLAGGLDADNVAEAIDTVRPWGVDVSSGVERERGLKDPAKIEAFIARVRALEDRHA